MKKRDVILIVTLLIIATLSYGAMRFFSQSGQRVIVTVDKKTVLEEPLSKDQELEIPLTNGKNTLRIKDNAVSMKTADCPDQICVRHKPISRSGETIVCLPHKVVVEITGEEDTDVDIVAYKGENL
jgi:hypothetical protein